MISLLLVGGGRTNQREVLLPVEVTERGREGQWKEWRKVKFLPSTSVVGHASIKVTTARLLVPAMHLHGLLCLIWDAHPTVG